VPPRIVLEEPLELRLLFVRDGAVVPVDELARGGELAEHYAGIDAGPFENRNGSP
jgi:hypothetical protein